MTVPQNFRTAFRGFHREDVVQYLEFIHNRHAQQVSDLQQECAQLREQLDQPHPAQEELDRLAGEAQQLRQEKEELEQRCAELEQARDEAQKHCAELERRCDELERRVEQAAPVPPCSVPVDEQLLSYRRAEQVEREAQERSQLVYYQAKAVLREAAGKVDAAAQEITGMADTVMGQLTRLQVAVSTSKQTLQEAASILDAIRPNP